MEEIRRLEGASESDWRSLLGRKVSVRYRLEHDPTNGFSEAIGIVMSVKPDESGVASVTILNRRGETATVAIENVVAGKAWVEPSDGG